MNVLVISPHPDDECLGVGGTIAQLAQAGCEVTVLTVAEHLPPLYPESTGRLIRDEAMRAHKRLRVSNSIFLDIPAVTLTEHPRAELNRSVQEALVSVRPKLVFIPFPDRHIDHRIVFDAAMVATRPVRAGIKIKLVAMYETLSETHWNAPAAEASFTPTWTVDISTTIEDKLMAYSCYESQLGANPGPRSMEAVKALSVFRGSQCSMNYGEAFQLVRGTFAPRNLFYA